MAHQACFHQPLGQEWRRRAGLCLGPLHLLSSCSPSFISFIIPPCPHSNLLPLHSSMSPNSCLMPPNTQSSFHPLPIFCFLCKPQGREMGEKHSLCTTVTKDRWVIAIYVSRLPPPTKNTRIHGKIHSDYPSPAAQLQQQTHAPARTLTYTRTVIKKPSDIWL